MIGILSIVKRFILIGDEKQLPAVVVQTDDETRSNQVPAQSERLRKAGMGNLSRSIFERLLDNCKQNGWHEAYGMLQDQGRMHIEIMDFPNKYYYDNLLQPISPWQSSPRLSLDHPLLSDKRVVFINTALENHRNMNTGEAKQVVQLIEELYELFKADFDDQTIGVITPYRAQIAQIRTLLSPELLARVTVNTVERYQGSQRRIIILSMAVNNTFQLRNLHVLNDSGTVDKKLNVALTRAKEHLIVLGCAEILTESPIYRTLIQYCQRRGRMV